MCISSTLPKKVDDKDNDGDNVCVAPRMLRNCLVEKTSDFATNRQQDAQEFFDYFLSQLERAEKPGLSNGRLGAFPKVSGNGKSVEMQHLKK